MAKKRINQRLPGGRSVCWSGWKGPYSSGIKALRPLGTSGEGSTAAAAVGSDIAVDEGEDDGDDGVKCVSTG